MFTIFVIVNAKSILDKLTENKLVAGKTAKSILISCGTRFAPFDIKELRELLEADDMELYIGGAKFPTA